MLGGTFLNIGSTTSFKLSDLSVVGYMESEGGCWGDFILNVLNPSGSIKDSYCWWDDPEEGVEAGWYNADGDVKYEADKIEFTAGQGFWIQGFGNTLNFDKLDL